MQVFGLVKNVLDESYSKINAKQDERDALICKRINELMGLCPLIRKLAPINEQNPEYVGSDNFEWFRLTTCWIIQ